MTASSAFGLAGGPFDNGGSSYLAETEGTYQAIFTFQDGSGYAYFSPNNSLQPVVSGSGASLSAAGESSTVQLVSQPLSIYNRSIIYYQGITYVGMATGASDLEAGIIQGTTNGTSDAGAGQVTGGTAGQTQTGGTTIVNNNGADLIANSNFTCHVTQNAPIIRFSGSGQLAIVSPNGFAAAATTIGTVIQQAYNDLTTAVTTTFNTANTALNTQLNNFAVAYSSSATNYVTGFYAATPNPNSTQLATLLSALSQIGTPSVAFTLSGQQAQINNLSTETAALENIANSAASALVTALTPPSAADIANNYTNTITMEVTGSLKYGLNIQPPATA